MLTAVFYFGIGIGVFCLFYVRMSSISWDELERRRLFRTEFHLGHLLELMESSDVRHMSKSAETKDELLRNFSAFLLEDVQRLHAGPIGLHGGCWVGMFYFGYGVVKAKSIFGWSRRDLLFLAGLELMVVRSVKGCLELFKKLPPMRPRKSISFRTLSFGMVILVFSVVTLTSHADYRRKLELAQDEIKLYQVIGDVLVDLLYANDNRPDLQEKLRALPFDKNDQELQAFSEAVVMARRDMTPENLDAVREAKKAFDAAHLGKMEQ